MLKKIVFLVTLLAALAVLATDYTGESTMSADQVIRNDGSVGESFSWGVTATNTPKNIWAEANIVALPYTAQGNIRSYRIQHCDTVDPTVGAWIRIGPQGTSNATTPTYGAIRAQGEVLLGVGEWVWYKHPLVKGTPTEGQDATWHVPVWVVNNNATDVDLCVTAYFDATGR